MPPRTGGAVAASSASAVLICYDRYMKQVIVIHGGTTFADYDSYINYLKTKEVSIDRFVHLPMWKESLQEKLGSNYQVLLPSMPNKTNAKYSEWKQWFDNISQLFSDDCILIGHSLGGIFLAKYLSENKFPATIKATVFVAAPYDDESAEDLADFKITGISNLFREQAGEVVFYYGTDDPVIPTLEAEKYRKQLPDAEFYELSAPDHFVRTDFPEVVSYLQKQ